MAVSLTKGQKVDLTKGNPGLEKVIVGLGWDTNRYDGSADFDLDASAFLLNANGKVLRDEDFIFYNNLNQKQKQLFIQGTTEQAKVKAMMSLFLLISQKSLSILKE